VLFFLYSRFFSISDLCEVPLLFIVCLACN
jgi:hypothetical protein